MSNELKTFNKIVDLNWAWHYEDESANDSWTQFECLNCMILESKWQQWKQNIRATTVVFKIIIGVRIATVMFDRMTF